jgi:hypothetical protein
VPAMHMRSVRRSSARVPHPRWPQKHHRLHAPRLTWAPAAVDSAGSPDDAQQQQQQQQNQQAQESDPELPANLPLKDSSTAVPDVVSTERPSNALLEDDHNIFSSEKASAAEALREGDEQQDWSTQQAQLFALHQAMQAQQQQQQQPPAVQSQDVAHSPAAAAALRSPAANAAARASYFADREAAMQAQQARHDTYMASEEGQRLGWRQGFPWPLSAVVAAIQGVLQAIKAVLALIPAVAASMRLKSLKQVLKRQAQAGSCICARMTTAHQICHMPCLPPTLIVPLITDKRLRDGHNHCHAACNRKLRSDLGCLGTWGA